MVDDKKIYKYLLISLVVFLLISVAYNFKFSNELELQKITLYPSSNKINFESKHNSLIQCNEDLKIIQYSYDLLIEKYNNYNEIKYQLDDCNLNLDRYRDIGDIWEFELSMYQQEEYRKFQSDNIK